jgi:hypothetical protein
MTNGETRSTDAGLTIATSEVRNYNGLRISCDLINEVSSDPSIKNYNITAMLGDIISLSSFMITFQPEHLYEPLYDTPSYNLYNAYERF